MEEKLAIIEVLKGIGQTFEDELYAESELYCLVDIGAAANELGHPELKEKYSSIRAIVPLKKADGGINLEVDASDLSGYKQLDCGIAVPLYVVEEADIETKDYQPKERMILNMA